MREGKQIITSGDARRRVNSDVGRLKRFGDECKKG